MSEHILVVEMCALFVRSGVFESDLLETNACEFPA